MNYLVSIARKWSVFWMSFFALALAACSSPTPDNVVKDFYKAVADNRVDDAVSHFSLKDVKENDLTEAKGKMQAMVGGEYTRIQGNGGLESVSTSIVEQKDDTVRVEVELKFKNGTALKERFNLQQESGRWKIVI